MTSAQVAIRVSTTRVVFTGQSLNVVPATNSYPMQLMNGYFPRVLWHNSAVSGAAWSSLDKTKNVLEAPWAAIAKYSILVMNGGTTDLVLDSTGLDVYTAMGAHATWARSVGFDYIIGTTITPDTGFTGPEETQRLDANSRILADVSGYFDAKIDFMSDARLTDASNALYYTGGLHWTEAGAGIAAGIAQPVLAPVLGAHP